MSTSSTSSLNILCAICSEYFKNTDIISSTTKCGHVFHHHCLQQWMRRSNTCPQCRANCHRHMVHRVYLNFSEPIPQDELDVEPIQTFDWFPIDATVTEEEIAKFGFKLDNDGEGNPIYAARVYYNDDLLPAYYVPKERGVYTAWGCSSHFLDEEIELLQVDNDNAEYKWVTAENGEVPEKALATGYAESGETLYISRAIFADRLRYGKLHPSHHCCYFPYEEHEKNNKTYEVLVRIPKEEKTQ